jgi:hypothetical protein
MTVTHDSDELGGSQVAAEAMPYHSHGRAECNTDRQAIGAGC